MGGTMTATLMLGKPVADAIIAKVGVSVAFLKEAHQLVPKLSVIQIGGDPASEVYIQNQVKSFARVGIEVDAHLLPDSVATTDVEGLIQRLGEDQSVHGIMVGLPLPAHMNLHRQQSKENIRSSTR
jgi:5,10-methylene-tetrahydrofolate dehydrogenase/methenyl tetrahydrofolate cyclohydrolase